MSDSTSSRLAEIKTVIDELIDLGRGIVNDSKTHVKQTSEKYSPKICDEFTKLGRVTVAGTEEFFAEIKKGASMLVRKLMNAIAEALEELKRLCEQVELYVSHIKDSVVRRVQTMEYSTEFHTIAKAANYLNASNYGRGDAEIPHENVEYTNKEKHHLAMFAHKLTGNMLEELANSAADNEHRQVYLDALDQHDMSAKSLKDLYVSGKSKLNVARDRINGAITGKSTGKTSLEYRNEHNKKDAMKQHYKNQERYASTSQQVASQEEEVRLADAANRKMQGNQYASENEKVQAKIRLQKALVKLEKKKSEAGRLAYEIDDAPPVQEETSSRARKGDARALLMKMHQLESD